MGGLIKGHKFNCCIVDYTLQKKWWGKKTTRNRWA